MLRKAFLIVSLLASFATVYAQGFVEDQDFFIRKGYTWSPGAEKKYTVTVIDPITDEEVKQERVSYILPNTINDRHVYTKSELKDAGNMPKSTELTAYILNELKPYVRQTWFADKSTVRSVTIHLQDIIVDEKGQIVFFDLPNVTGSGPDGRLRDLDYSRLKSVIGGIVDGAPRSQPATINGNPVTAYTDVDLGNTEISFDGSKFHFRDVAVKKEK